MSLERDHFKRLSLTIGTLGVGVIGKQIPAVLLHEARVIMTLEPQREVIKFVWRYIYLTLKLTADKTSKTFLIK